MTLIEWTGNPFVDSGIAATLVYCKKRKPEDVTTEDLQIMSKLVQEVYCSGKWKKAMYSIFLNYPLSQPSYKTEEKKREKLKEFLDALLSDVEEIQSGGDCIACGRRKTRRRKNRQHIPMTGSGGALNYFSFTAEGADYCDTCAFTVQCSPFTYYACGKLALLHSNSAKVMRRWAGRTIADVQQQVASGGFTGCFNEGYTNPQNALFHLAQDLIVRAEDDWREENPSLRLYHFTNYIQKPELDIYDLPAPVFKFLAEVRRHPRFRDWKRIVNRGFYFVKKGQQINLSVEGKAESENKNSKNRIYQDLLTGRPILHRFINIGLHKAYGDFSLLEVYLTEVLAMDITRIEVVKKVADDIANFIRQSSDGKKRLQNLEAATKYPYFCNALRKISRERIALGAATPLFTLQEFTEGLFPEGSYFTETRYLILFRLYEQLHDWLLEQGITKEEADDDIVEVSGDKPLAANDNEDTQLLGGAIQ
jgi:CRISPR-associated protein Cst1